MSLYETAEERAFRVEQDLECANRVIASLRAEVERLRPRQQGDGSTHWEGCWEARHHHDCAVAEIKGLRVQSLCERCHEGVVDPGERWMPICADCRPQVLAEWYPSGVEPGINRAAREIFGMLEVLTNVPQIEEILRAALRRETAGERIEGRLFADGSDPEHYTVEISPDDPQTAEAIIAAHDGVGRCTLILHPNPESR